MKRVTAPALALALAAGGGAGAAAQASARAAAPAGGPVGAPAAVLLRLRPRAGDTVRTQFEQTVRFLARGGGEAVPAPSGRMTVYAHAVVERVGAAGALVLAVTDSVTLKASGTPAHATEAARRAMQGRRQRLRLTPDGATAVLGAGGSADPSMRFPALLPGGAVAPGAMWARAMPLPGGAVAPGATAQAAGTSIDVWFRLDSLGRGGTLAFVSMRGTLRAPAGGDDPLPSPGGVRGALVVDLARGWVVDSRAAFELDGALTAPGGAPRPVRVVVTQRLRVL